MRPSWLPICIALVCGGCYTYAPLESTHLAPNTLVRARVSATEADRLQQYLPNSDRVLEGEVVSADNAEVVIQVPATMRTSTAGIQVLHQRVSISRAGIVELESKRLSRTRTALVVGAVATAAAVVVVDAVRGNPGKDGPPGEEPGPEFRAPILRIRF